MKGPSVAAVTVEGVTALDSFVLTGGKMPDSFFFKVQMKQPHPRSRRQKVRGEGRFAVRLVMDGMAGASVCRGLWYNTM